MLYFRYLAPAIIAVTAFAGSIAYFIMPSLQTAASVRLFPERPAALLLPDPLASSTGQKSVEEAAADEFLRAAREIVRKAPDARAAIPDSAEPSITGRVPLPRRRPISR
jgi:hypothetical protein